VEGSTHSIVTAVSIVPTAAKNVTQPDSPKDPHFSLEKLYIPESSPIIRSFCRSDGWDLRRRDIGLDEDGSASRLLLLVEWRDVVIADLAGRVRCELGMWKEDAL
jgi:hypothetical protein